MQAPLIMMSQNRQGDKDRLRADLDYQVNLKNALALAEVMRRVDVLESERLPLLFAEQNARLRAQMGDGRQRRSFEFCGVSGCRRRASRCHKAQISSVRTR